MSQIAHSITSRAKDVGGFNVRRLLPASQKRMVGPFIFYDHMGPATFPPGSGIDVRPHPHIGLATVTYLFSGEILHRDSLGSEQIIWPGEVNWMTAGRGIVHSERSVPAHLASGQSLHGIQLWVALPRAHEDTEPAFFHYSVADLPVIQQADVTLTLIVGTAFAQRSPAPTYSDMFYLDTQLSAGQTVTLPDDHEERALYVADGQVQCDGATYDAGTMLIYNSDRTATATACCDSRVMLLGGAPLQEERHIWWNFVSSSTERIEQAKKDWRERRFAPVPGDNKDFIPLPEH